FADTDGDDIADHREILFGPLGYEKDTHGMCSSFRLGLDGWVYATHGFNNTSRIEVRADRWRDGGKMTNSRMTNDERSPNAQNPNAGASSLEPLHSFVIPHSSFDIPGRRIELHSGNVFRFRPDGSRVEKYTSGQVNPFGLAWDRYGNLYSADCHSSPIYQLIRGACYPSFGKPHDGLGFAPVMCQHTHGSTGICGIVYIDGGVWGPEWDDHTFVGNVVTSKVNHDHVTFTGSTPKANEQPDFLTSDDPWFRPVDLQLGPDNALYISDFYNKIIGHYEVPLEHPGRDKERGRIWRVVKKDTTMTSASVKERLSNLESLIDSMGAPNLTLRGIAIRETVVKHVDKKVALQLRRMLQEPQSSPYARASALAVLNQKDYQAADTIVRCSELELVATNHLEAEYETDVHVSLAVAWPTGTARERLSAVEAAIHRPAMEEILLMAHVRATDPPGDLLLHHGLDLALRRALGVSGAYQAYELRKEGLRDLGADRVIARVSKAVSNPEASEWLLRFLNSTNAEHVWANETELIETWKSISRNATSLKMPAIRALISRRLKDRISSEVRLVEAIYDAFAERGTPPPPELLAWAQELATQLLDATAKQPTPAWTTLGDATWSLQPRKLANDTEATVLQSLINGGGDEESRTGMLKSQTFPAPAKLALWINGHRGFPNAKAHDKNLVRITDAETGRELARAFPPRSDTAKFTELDLAAHIGKPVRLEVIDGDDGKAYAWLGITGIEPALVSVNDFQNADSTRESLKTLAIMLQHSAPAALREKLATYLPPRPAPPPLPVSPEQRKQLDTLIASRTAAFAKAKPDIENGANVFKMNCAACHQIKGQGGLIGPQLDGIGARGAGRLCEDILDPNRNVDAHFHLHALTMKDNSTFAGFLKAELGQIHLLADATGKEHRVAKTDIQKTEVTPISLMPPTFGQTLNEATFNDLLGYLMNEKVGN
ncbi:MAG: c-type cytochrome, partial [Prosthecobacter sp.]|nr:c-type cytochrome [Prosthecobacter sp.]